jgi:Arc/MetJ-type ribon-helix-helix transcriptional regulator
MSVDIPSTLQGFVNDELSAGTFANESELVTTALNTYREMKQRHRDLKARVAESLKQVEQGQVAPMDMEGIKLRLRRFVDESNSQK